MRQLILHLGSGITEVLETPAPAILPGHVLIRTHASLVSAGTERMLVEFGRSSLMEKARQQPERIAALLEKLRADGLLATISAVSAKLEQPVPLGYCNVGTVVAVGVGSPGFQVGDRVASNGPHAEIVAVPAQLCARVPDTVSNESAVFTIAGSIALQGIRLLAPTIGETVVVTGVGLVGLLAIQILRANGCRVLAVDLEPNRLELARSLGATTIDARTQDPPTVALAMTAGRGVDGVLITASTDSNAPIRDAARMARQRGRIVLTGVAGLELSRADFYAKELTFQVSCSYGPGRHDPDYEQDGHDYPFGFVRWTEQRNFEAVLGLMESGTVKVDALVTHRFPIGEAAHAYGALLRDRQAIGIVFTYNESPDRNDSVASRVVVLPRPRLEADDALVCGVVGAGNYASRVLIPAFSAAGVVLNSLVSNGSVSSANAARKLGFGAVSTDIGTILDDPKLSTLVVATRHESHARYVLAGLKAGKHIYCEKPLCLSLDELRAIDREVGSRPNQVLMVGFNRRFAPLVRTAMALLDSIDSPRSIVITVNPGAIPRSHWTQRRDEGGGRFVGEGCHFVDLLRFISGVPVVRWEAIGAGRSVTGSDPSECATVIFEFANGSTGTVHYLANGHKQFPKERIEVFAGGRILQLDDFRRLRGWGWKGSGDKRAWRQNKGQSECVRSFVSAVRAGSPAPIPWSELFEVSRISIEAQQALDS